MKELKFDFGGNMKDIDFILNEIRQFRDERDWRQFHNPKDLAITISLESAELLEVFQWSAKDLYCLDKRDMIKDELADILISAFQLADEMD